MTHYCTYFDSNYLPQGVAMAESLRRHDPAAVLWVLTLDDRAQELVRRLGLPGVYVVEIESLLDHDERLADIRTTRSRREFIFTVTACWIRMLFETKPDLPALAYVDADMWFFDDPAAAWGEMGAASVMVVPHRYPSWHDDSNLYGRFNVGWLAFRNDATARSCLARWREQCLESCGLVAGGGSFGDQLYLNEWPENLGDKLAVLGHEGVNLAPWNWASCVDLRVVDGRRVAAGKRPLVLFHFAQLKRISANWWDSGQLEYGVMPEPLRTAIYGPYLDALDAAAMLLRKVDPRFEMPVSGWRAAMGPWHLALLRLFWGQFWRRSANGRLRSGRFGLGRWSGRFFGFYRRWQRRRS